MAISDLCDWLSYAIFYSRIESGRTLDLWDSLYGLFYLYLDGVLLWPAELSEQACLGQLPR
jgi:hypothetical protein